MIWLRQMAQLSTTISQAQRATAFHYVMLALSSTYVLSCDAHLLDLETLLVAVSASTGLASLRLHRGRICHIDVRHGCGECVCGGVCGELTGAGGGGEVRLWARHGFWARMEEGGTAPDSICGWRSVA
jgi:hypothetical protein